MIDRASLDDLRLEQFLRNRNSGKLVWKTKEGELIPIKDITDEHLNNIIQMLTTGNNNTTNILPSSLNFY